MCAELNGTSAVDFLQLKLLYTTISKSLAPPSGKFSKGPRIFCGRYTDLVALYKSRKRYFKIAHSSCNISAKPLKIFFGFGQVIHSQKRQRAARRPTFEIESMSKSQLRILGKVEKSQAPGPSRPCDLQICIMASVLYTPFQGATPL